MNQRPPVCETGALPAELSARHPAVPDDGLEPKATEGQPPYRDPESRGLPSAEPGVAGPVGINPLPPIEEPQRGIEPLLPAWKAGASGHSATGAIKAPGGNRTRDLRAGGATLWPAELRVQWRRSALSLGYFQSAAGVASPVREGVPDTSSDRPRTRGRRHSAVAGGRRTGRRHDTSASAAPFDIPSLVGESNSALRVMSPLHHAPMLTRSIGSGPPGRSRRASRRNPWPARARSSRLRRSLGDSVALLSQVGRTRTASSGATSPRSAG